MKKYALILICAFFLSIFLFPSSSINAALETIVKVVEGEVYCFDYPPEMTDVITEGEVQPGIYLYRLNEYSAKVLLKEKAIDCYLPYEFRDQIWGQLQPKSKVLLLKNQRRVYQTEWDLISVGRGVTEGESFLKSEIKEMSQDEKDEYEEIANELKKNVDSEEQEQIETIEEDTIDEILDEEQNIEPIDDETDDLPIPSPDDENGIDIPQEEEIIGDGEGPQEEKEELEEEEIIVPPPPEPEPEPGPTPLPEPTAFYVDATNGDNTSHGDTWADAWETISYALSEIEDRELTSATVYLRGTFTGDFPRTIAANSPQASVHIIGEGPASTILDAEGSSNFYTVLNRSNALVFSNIGFQNGNAGGAGEDGGAFFIDNATVYFNNCSFSNCQASDKGGVIYGVNATVAIPDCTFSNNTADEGGVINMRDATSNSLSDFFVYDSTTYTNTAASFSNNTATGSGLPASVMYVFDATVNFTNGTFTVSNNNPTPFIVFRSTISIAGATFSNNQGTWGSGLTLALNSSASVDQCVFNDNNSEQGALSLDPNCTADVINCLFYDNTATLTAAGIYFETSTMNIFNCTFDNNSNSGSDQNGISSALSATAVIRNCILNDDDGLLVVDDGTGTITVEYCDLFSSGGASLVSRGGVDVGGVAEMITWGWDSGGTNISSDPQFIDSSANNYKIVNTDAAVSPCVDAGVDLSGSGVTVDIEDVPRPQGSGYDMGAYEKALNDPPITGRVYDSVTGELVSSPTIAIYRKNVSEALDVTTSNPYTFNVTPGTYHLAVSKSGYGFPSEVVSTVATGDHGELFIAQDDPLTIDLPMDSGGWLYVEKTVNKKRATIGEIVTYNIKVQNKNWYQAVTGVELVDDITNGFKYVPGSTYRGGAELADPTISGRKAIFDIGTVSARSSFNISYQVRVGTGIPPGRYKASANTRNSTSLSRNSNVSSTSIEVQEDPLFTRGTIIGKVFYDINGNGIQDSSDESGIDGVEIYTEYGVYVETDEDGKYHIPDVPEGNHLLKVDPSTLPQDSEFVTKNPLFVKVTEGLFVKANFGISQNNAQNKAEKDGPIKNFLSRFFIVALGEGTLSNLNTSGNIKMADKNSRFDDGVNVDGRLAFYLKGKVLGKYLVKACVDTERLPGRRYRRKDLFTNLDPDKYYPVYGDASKINYDGVDTQDVAYVLIEWDESFAKWGSFNTEFPFNLYERTLSGGVINYVSKGETKFGDPWTQLKGFSAVSRQQAAHDEFVGTSGSLYYLRHRDVIEGSEKLKVEVRDRVSKSTISSIVLSEEKDYEIDYDSGRVLLKKPLNSIHQGYSNSIISNDLLMGERVYLVIDYEYLNDGLSDSTWGVRASQQIGHHVRIGGSYVQEQKAGPNYEVASGDATIKLNKDTSINAFYGHSEETQLGSSTSYDGGLNFNNQFNTFSDGESGEGYNVNAKTKLFQNTDVYLSYSNYDPYFSITNSISQQGTEKYIASVYSKLTNDISVGIRHLTSKIKEQTTPIADLGARDVYVTSGVADYRRDKWDLRAEYQHQEIINPSTSYTYFGMLPLQDNDFVALRVGYQLYTWLHPYLRGQATVRGRVNNQGTIGADVSIWESTQLNIAETVGNMGNSTLVGLTSKVSEDTDVYANLEVGNHLSLGKFAKTTYGQSMMLNSTSRAYMEEDYSSYRENVVRGTVSGYEGKINETLGVGLSYERSDIESSHDRNVINRDAGSIAFTYLNPDEFIFNTKGIKGYSKLEIRDDRGSNNVRQWLTENDILWRLTDGVTLSTRVNWGWSENRSLDTDEAQFYEIGTGFSLRPVTWDRLNILGKYSYLTNLPPDSQWDFIEDIESKRHVYALEGAFDVVKWLQLVGKFAYRDMEEKVGSRSWTESDTYLYIGRVNLHITDAWDVATEYRTLANDQIEDEKAGWLVEVDREIGKYVRLGVGYNFTDYDDDLRNEDNWDAKGWFIRANAKY